jgi:hypothetical protein
MTRLTKIAFATALLAASASAALAEDSSSSFDKQLDRGGHSAYGMTSRSVSLQNNSSTARKAQNRASQVLEGGSR